MNTGLSLIEATAATSGTSLKNQSLWSSLHSEFRTVKQEKLLQVIVWLMRHRWMSVRPEQVVKNCSLFSFYRWGIAKR